MKFKIFIGVMLAIIAIATLTTAGALVYTGVKIKTQTKDVTSKVDTFNKQVENINQNLQNLNNTLRTNTTQLQKQASSLPSNIPGL